MDERKCTDKELHEFFSGLADRMTIAASYEKRIARFEAPRFNVFKYIEPNEARVTKILGDILDPKGSHGQGDVFLRSFLKAMGFARPTSEEIENAAVRPEDRTNENRRVDLTVTMGPHILGLENKIGAGEQPEQIGHYMQWLRTNANGSWLLIFLTPDGCVPTTCDEQEWKAAVKNNQALSLPYSALSSWLFSCVTLAPSDRVRGFIQDMATWAKNPLGGKMAGNLYEQSILGFFDDGKNGRFLETLLAVQDTSDVVRVGLIIPFAKDLEKEVTAKFEASEWIVSSKISETDLQERSPGITVRHTSWPPRCEIGIVADTWKSPFGYGIYWPDASKNARERLKSEFQERKWRNGRSSPTWPWWADVPEFEKVLVKNWNESQTLMLMQGEKKRELINHFVKCLIALQKVVRDLDLGELQRV